MCTRSSVRQPEKQFRCAKWLRQAKQIRHCWAVIWYQKSTWAIFTWDTPLLWLFSKFNHQQTENWFSQSQKLSPQTSWRKYWQTKNVSKSTLFKACVFLVKLLMWPTFFFIKYRVLTLIFLFFDNRNFKIFDASNLRRWDCLKGLKLEKWFNWGWRRRWSLKYRSWRFDAKHASTAQFGFRRWIAKKLNVSL